MYRFETFILDISERQLFDNGKAVSLTPKVFDVLAYLVERAGHLIGKEELLSAVWPDSYVEEANISRIVHTLRRTLGEAADGSRLIETVPKRGYRFTGKVTTVERDAYHAASAGAAKEQPFFLRSFWVSGAVLGLLIGLMAAFFFLLPGQTRGLIFDGMVPSRLTASGDVHAPDISLDGKLLLYIKQSGGMFGLQLQDQKTGESRELLPPRPGVRFWGARFNNDGRYVYYVENKNNDLGTLYRIASSGGEIVRIASHVSGGPKISPDGRLVLFIRVDKEAGTNSIMIGGAEGGDERVIVSTDTNSVFMSADWNPDGASVTYVLRNVAEEKSLYSIIDRRIDGGSERVIIKPSERSIISALWMPRSNGLVINAIDQTSKLPQIFFREFPDGTERRITNDLGYYYHISLTADGHSIFAQKIEQDRYIWFLPDVDSSAATQLTFEKDQHFDGVDWLDEETLVFDPDFNGSHQSRNLWKLDIDTQKAVPLTQGFDDNTIPKVAPNRSLTFISSKNGPKQLWQTNLNGANPVQLTNIPHRIYAYEPSADGRWIYFQYSDGGDGTLVRVPAGGGELTRLGGKEIFDWALSPDGTKLAYRSPDESGDKFAIKIRLVSDPQTLQSFPVESANQLTWSRDGNNIYFVADADIRKNVWSQPLNGGAAFPITDFSDAEVLAFAQSPSGKSLAVIRSSTSFDAVRFDFSK